MPLLLLLLLHFWECFTPPAVGQVVQKRGLKPPLGVRIGAGLGPNGPRRVAIVNGISIIFEPSIDDEEIVADENPLIDGDDAILEKRRPLQRWRLQISRNTAEKLTFGIRSDDESAERATELFSILLRDELQTIDGACNLTQAQRKKLTLAGRGDMKHFIDRAARLWASLENAARDLTDDEFPDWANGFGAEHASLRQILDVGIFGVDSLFFRTQSNTLTPEQLGLLVLAKLRDSEYPAVRHMAAPTVR